MPYPSYKISMTQSDREIVDDLQLDEWPNMSARGRAFADAVRYRFVLTHPALTQAEADALEAYYFANRTAPFDFVDRFVTPSVTRNNVMFEGKPVIKRNESSGANRTFRATV